MAEGIQLSVALAMTRKNLLVAFRYPVNVTCRVLGVAAIVPAYLLAVSCFMPGGVAGLTSTSAGRLLVGIVVYGFIIYQFSSDALWMIGFYLRQEQVEGTLEALYVTPANSLVYLFTRLIEPLALSSLNALMALVVGLGLFHLPVPEHGGLALFALLGAVLGIFGLSFGMAALSLLYFESAQAIAGGVQFALLTGCAMIYPFSALPPGARQLAQVIPLSYAVDLFRSALLCFPAGYPELASVRSELVVVALWGLVTPALGIVSYRWAERRARALGLIGRF